MLNSISFSSDLETLFLIEEAQVVAFPLSSKKGIIIGKLEDQLVAGSHKEPIKKKHLKVQEFELDKSQVQFYYSEKVNKAFLIIIDIDFSKDAPAKYATKSMAIDLNRENLILNKIENKLRVIRLPILVKLDPESDVDRSAV